MHAPIKKAEFISTAKGPIQISGPKTHKARNLIRHSVFEQLWDARHKNDRHMGLGWNDMPGDTPDSQKMNFFLFRRGRLYDPELFPRMSPVNRSRYCQFIQRAALLPQPKVQLSY